MRRRRAWRQRRKRFLDECRRWHNLWLSDITSHIWQRGRLCFNVFDWRERRWRDPAQRERRFAGGRTHLGQRRRRLRFGRRRRLRWKHLVDRGHPVRLRRHHSQRREWCRLDWRRRRGRSHCHLSCGEPVWRNDFRLWRRRSQLGRSGNRLPPAHRTEWPAHFGQRRTHRNQHAGAIRKFRGFDFTQQSDWVGIQFGKFCQFAVEFKCLAGFQLWLQPAHPNRVSLVLRKCHHSGRWRHHCGHCGLSSGSGFRLWTKLLPQQLSL